MNALRLLPPVALLCMIIACKSDGSPPSGPTTELLSHYVPGVQIGTTFARLKEQHAGITFRPYDGYSLAMLPARDGLQTAVFKGAEPFPESEPAPSSVLTEVELTGDAPDVHAIASRLSLAYGSSSNLSGCLRSGSGVRAEIHVWSDKQASAELMVPSGPGAGRATLRFLLGSWSAQRYGQHYTRGSCG